ncbi:MAG TPA: hypothetical protein VFT43_09950 [Candidatus Polarisedimenticolia bacterium]|nr:hypothetical protein [Candidatus Polarisedimenticolia bacterium]
MDMFLLFAVIFLCVMFSLGVSALALSLLFRVILRVSGDRDARVAVAAALPSQAPRA